MATTSCSVRGDMADGPAAMLRRRAEHRSFDHPAGAAPCARSRPHRRGSGAASPAHRCPAATGARRRRVRPRRRPRPAAHARNATPSSCHSGSRAHLRALRRRRRVEVLVRSDAGRAEEAAHRHVDRRIARGGAERRSRCAAHAAPRPPASRNACSAGSAVTKYWPVGAWWYSTTVDGARRDRVDALPDDRQDRERRQLRRVDHEVGASRAGRRRLEEQVDPARRAGRDARADGAVVAAAAAERAEVEHVRPVQHERRRRQRRRPDVAHEDRLRGAELVRRPARRRPRRRARRRSPPTPRARRRRARRT